LLQRKQRLQALLAKTKAEENRTILFSEHWTGSGRELLDRTCAMGLEGIIAKRCDEPYQPARTRSWLKIKCSKSQEFVIGGYTDPAGTRMGFGALLLGVNEDGRLRYTGRVGTGFDGRLLRELRRRFDPLRRQSSPFSIMPKNTRLSGVHWLEPELVCEVVFTGWTSDGLLRHPSFKALRDDKPAGEVRREFPTRLSD
jgi:bifunctional non-homologous end joining protein LigD